MNEFIAGFSLVFRVLAPIFTLKTLGVTLGIITCLTILFLIVNAIFHVMERIT